MYKNGSEFEKDAADFLDKVWTNLTQAMATTGFSQIDHVCYRTSDQENYVEAKQFFASIGELLTEEPVSGRPIATFKLQEPLIFNNYLIGLVEVPAPKKGKVTAEGLEHIEIVVADKLENIISTYPHLTFSTKGMIKDFNPELEIEFEDCAVKFHHMSLENVIHLEKNQKVRNFLSETQILKNFKSFSPCLSGTLALGIETEKSDLDILFESQDLTSFAIETEKSFSSFDNFKKTTSIHQGLDSVTVTFSFLDLEVELFCQDLNPYKQQANRHFLIESRLLSMSDHLHRQIRDLKQQGLKTEPAFGKVFGLAEPYQDLINLGKENDLYLKNFINERINERSS